MLVQRREMAPSVVEDISEIEKERLTVSMTSSAEVETIMGSGKGSIIYRRFSSYEE